MRISTAGVARKGDTFLAALRNSGTSIGESWEFPGGKAEPGEEAKDALMREYREELGIEIDVGALLYEGFFSNRGTEYRLMAFEVVPSTDEFVLTEHQSVKWLTTGQLNELPMAHSDRQILNYLIETQRGAGV